MKRCMMAKDVKKGLTAKVKPLFLLARPTGIEPVTFSFGN